MQSYKSESIRNVALLSHSKAGKTSLSEAILFNAGHTTRLGRVEDGKHHLRLRTGGGEPGRKHPVDPPSL